MNRYYFTLEGTSGTGKGTRTLQLMMFLESLGYQAEVVKIELPMTKAIYNLAGRYYRDLNLLFIGKFLKSNTPAGLYNWSSIDCLCSNNTRFEPLDESLPKILFSDMITPIIRYSNCNIIVEGYPSLTPDIRTLHPYFSSLYTKYLYYDNMDQLLERCYGRSGRMCKGHASWSTQGKSKSIQQQLDKFLAEHPELTNKYHNDVCSFNDPVENFGIDVLQRLKPELVDQFKQFCSQSSFLRHHSEKEKNHNQLEPFYQEQSKTDKCLILTPQWKLGDQVRVTEDGKNFNILVDEKFPEKYIIKGDVKEL